MVKQQTRQQIKRKILRKLNRPIAAKSIKAALTDKQVRARIAELVAEGKASPKVQTGIESALRQSRRVNADYSKHHVAAGGDAELDRIIPAADALKSDKLSSEARAAAKQEAKLTKGVGGRTEQQRAKQGNATEKTDNESARTSFGDGRGRENLADSEGVAQSASEGRITFTGPHFGQTQRMADGKVAAARRRDELYELLAWGAYEAEYPTEAGELNAVFERETEETRALRARQPEAAFARDLASYLRRATRGPGPGRARRAAELGSTWRHWRAYLGHYRHRHPDAQLPQLGVQHRYANPNRAVLGEQRPAARNPLITEAVAAAIRKEAVPRWKVEMQAYEDELRATMLAESKQPDPLEAAEAAWVAAGMPIGWGGLIRLSTFEERMRQVEQATRWEPLLRAKTLENNARLDWYNLYRRHRPRPMVSLLDL